MYLDTTYKPERVHDEDAAVKRPLLRARIDLVDGVPDRGQLVVTNGAALAALSVRVEEGDDLGGDVPVELLSTARKAAKFAGLGELRVELRKKRAVSGNTGAPRKGDLPPAAWRHTIGPTRGEAGTVTLALDAEALLALAYALGAGGKVPARVALTLDPREPLRAIGVELIDGPLRPDDVGALAPCRSSAHLGLGERTSLRVDKPKEDK